MKLNKILPILLITLLGTACGSGTATEAHDHAHAHDHGHAAQEAADQDDHTATGTAVQLDNGQTWEANIETTEGIASMEALVGSYAPGSDDGQLLKEGLEAEFQDIFAKCTMTGEAHDQLHNYLAPVHKMLKELGPEPSEAELDALGEYLATYTDYFH